MARSVPAVQQALVTGLTPALTAPSVDGDTLPTGSYILWVENASGGALTVTIPSPMTVHGLAVGDGGTSIPNGQRRFFGPFPAGVFAQPSTEIDAGTVRVDYSTVTSVTRGLFRA